MSLTFRLYRSHVNNKFRPLLILFIFVRYSYNQSHFTRNAHNSITDSAKVLKTPTDFGPKVQFTWSQCLINTCKGVLRPCHHKKRCIKATARLGHSTACVLPGRVPQVRLLANTRASAKVVNRMLINNELHLTPAKLNYVCNGWRAVDYFGSRAWVCTRSPSWFQFWFALACSIR
jgi:hypothetical protein